MLTPNTFHRLLAPLLAGLLLSGCQEEPATTAAPTPAPPAPPAVTEQIMVDQFGFRPDAVKVAVFADPVEGQNNANRYTPGPRFQIRRVADDVSVFEGPTESQFKGEVQKSSGDRVWWGDFSALQTPGAYYVYDPEKELRSFPFQIAPDVYGKVFRAACRMFFYNRSNTEKKPEHAGAWVHAKDHPQQEKAEFYDTAPRGEPRDVSGGWFDAGDYNKYVPFASSAIWGLLDSYEVHPTHFGDDTNLPESGNGTPDILDEVRWELTWLLKMQDEKTGGVFNLAGSKDGGVSVGGDPALDTAPWYYTSVTTWATASFAANTAHAARVYGPSDAAFAATLRAASERAWAYLEAHPKMEPEHGNDTAKGVIAAGDATGSSGLDERLRLWASAELFRLTGEERYHAYFKAHHLDPALKEHDHHPVLNGIVGGGQAEQVNFAYLAYCRTPGADPKIVANYHRVLLRACKGIEQGYLGNGYRNEFADYYWSSNQLRAARAVVLLWAIDLGLNPDKHAKYRQVAEEYVHYFHGRNPLNLVYLTNMGPKGANLGASKSAVQPFHYWFKDGTKYDGIEGDRIGPAPGYLVGGPNKYSFSKQWMAPPFGQPEEKSFVDWNTVWNEARKDTEEPWAFTEPAIYYQARFVRLLSAFVQPVATTETKATAKTAAASN